MAELAMFPLGTVLVPSLVLPLHVFEPRYRELVRRCLAGEPEFGVVLIERGSEVGGGDVRSSIGTVARIIEAAELDDGRWALATVGTRRVRVQAWLDDDPFPRAEVEDWPDDDEVLTDVLAEAFGVACTHFRRVLGLLAELAEPAPPIDVTVADDPVLGSFQLTALGPFGPADQQSLLAVPGAAQRLAILTERLAEEEAFLVQRLEMG